MKITVSTDIDRPVAAVWQWYAVEHVRNHPRWDPDMELEQISQGPIGLVTRAQHDAAHCRGRLLQHRRVEGRAAPSDDRARVQHHSPDGGVRSVTGPGRGALRADKGPGPGLPRSMDRCTGSPAHIDARGT